MTIELIEALLNIRRGLTVRTLVDDRHQLYRLGLIRKHATLTYVREVTEKGEAFLKMLEETPLPVEVNTPRWADPRKDK